MKIDSACYQSTECELDYLRKIGGWKSGIPPTGKERQRYLRGYLEGAKLRVNWGMIKKETVLEYVWEELENVR